MLFWHTTFCFYSLHLPFLSFKPKKIPVCVSLTHWTCWVDHNRLHLLSHFNIKLNADVISVSFCCAFGPEFHFHSGVSLGGVEMRFLFCNTSLQYLSFPSCVFFFLHYGTTYGVPVKRKKSSERLLLLVKGKLPLCAAHFTSLKFSKNLFSLYDKITKSVN